MSSTSIASAANTLSMNATHRQGLVTARPHIPTHAPPPAGRTPLLFGERRDGFLYMPRNLSASSPAPLVVFFHGAGGPADHAEVVLPAAESEVVVVLSTDSRGRTWDVILGLIGPDVEFLDRALAWTFDRVHVDPARVAVSGFSDGASYALSVGLANGDLFPRVLAFSPGFQAPPELHGQPHIFISHGVDDRVLPISRCSRRIVPRLQKARYVVDYHEFPGAHIVPELLARKAIASVAHGA